MRRPCDKTSRRTSRGKISPEARRRRSTSEHWNRKNRLSKNNIPKEPRRPVQEQRGPCRPKEFIGAVGSEVGHYFKHHRVVLEKRLAIHIEIKNASTPAQIVSCQLTSLSAKATAAMAKKAEMKPSIRSARNPTSRSMLLIRFSRRVDWRIVS